MADSQRSGAVEALGQLAQASALGSKTGEGVLDNGVLYVVLTQLRTKRGILSHGDALIVHEDAAGGPLELLGHLSHDSLLGFQDICVRHLGFTSREIMKKRCFRAQRRTQREIT